MVLDGRLDLLGLEGDSRIFAALRADGSDNLRSLINAASNRTGVVASLDENNRLVLTAPDGRNIIANVVGLGTALGFGVPGTYQGIGGLALSSERSFHLDGDIGTLNMLGSGGEGHHRTTALTSRDYLFCNTPATYDDAVADCEARGAHLVGVTHENENEWLWQNAQNLAGDSLWLLGHRIQDGAWMSEVDQSFAIDNFADGQRDEPGQCAALTPDSTQWDRVVCNTMNRYICIF